MLDLFGVPDRGVNHLPRHSAAWIADARHPFPPAIVMLPRRVTVHNAKPPRAHGERAVGCWLATLQVLLDLVGLVTGSLHSFLQLLLGTPNFLAPSRTSKS